MKICTNPNCSRVNPQERSSFHKKKGSKDGLKSRCKLCHNLENAIYRKSNPEKERARGANYRENNPEKNRSSSLRWQKANRDKCIVNQVNWRRNNLSSARAKERARRNKNIERVRAQNLRWQKDNPGKVNARNAKRHALKLQATPKWLIKQQLLEIIDFYLQAARLTKETGIPHEVDHIIPLQGENVKGLHVPWNLQVLTKTANIKKGNKIIA